MKLFLRVILFAIVAAFLSPIISLMIEAGRSLFSETLGVANSLLLTYAQTSIVLVLGSIAGATLFGLSAAYLCARYDFLGRTLLLWGSILPLGVPSYLVAYTWVDFLVDQGIAGGSLRNLPMTCMIFALCLSPYIFLPTYTALSQLPGTFLESARLLGCKGSKLFTRIELPLVRPALFAGALLAALEVLADFGTVDFMAVDTWTTAIYRNWFGYDERSKASLLASILFLISAALLFWESKIRSRKHIAQSGRRPSPLRRVAISWKKVAPLSFIAATPAVLGCLLPLAILTQRTLQGYTSEGLSTVIQPTLTTLSLAATASLIVVGLALILVWILRKETNRMLRFFARVSSLGYALPGGVLGLGLLIFLAPFSLSGSIIGLVFGYCVRFATIGTSSIEAGWIAIPSVYEAQARILGCSESSAFFRVTLPLLRKSMLCAIILTSIDVIKELPATMLLRPFNLETLAIRTYNLASDERLAETAPSALAMVVLCLGGIFIAQKFGAFELHDKTNTGDSNVRSTSIT